MTASTFSVTSIVGGRGSEMASGSTLADLTANHPSTSAGGSTRRLGTSCSMPLKETLPVEEDVDYGEDVDDEEDDDEEDYDEDEEFEFQIPTTATSLKRNLMHDGSDDDVIELPFCYFIRYFS